MIVDIPHEVIPSIYGGGNLVIDHEYYLHPHDKKWFFWIIFYNYKN